MTIQVGALVYREDQFLIGMVGIVEYGEIFWRQLKLAGADYFIAIFCHLIHVFAPEAECASITVTVNCCIEV